MSMKNPLTLAGLYTVLGKNYSKGSIVSVDMDVVGVMAAYFPVVCVCVYCTV
jgi:hypothetical protein